MTAAVSAQLAPGTQRATAEFLLDQLDQLAASMTGLRPVAEQLAGQLYPVAVRPPLAGEATLVCSGCRSAVDRSELRWWPRPSGMKASLRVGCAGCVTAATDQLVRGYR